MKYVRNKSFENNIGTKKEFIKEVKQFYHKMRFRIPISMKEVEHIAGNPYFHIGYSCSWESRYDRIQRICANRVIRELLINEGVKGQEKVWLE